MNQFSAFILTFNSAKYLEKIIVRLQKACDEIIIVDSGSTDGTKSISEKHGCRFVVRRFDNFKNQRAFALAQCRHDWVLMIDSDEVPDDSLIAALQMLKAGTNIPDACRLRREWYVLGKKIHAMYPVVSPDYPVRLFDKRKSNFDNSPEVHEEPSGYETIGVLGGTLQHFTFESKQEITDKLERYTSLSAETLIKKGKSLSALQQLLSAIAAFVKWYFVMGGWKDGLTGIVLAKYAFDYTFLKYEKARKKIGRAHV